MTHKAQTRRRSNKAKQTKSACTVSQKTSKKIGKWIPKGGCRSELRHRALLSSAEEREDVREDVPYLDTKTFRFTQINEEFLYKDEPQEETLEPPGEEIEGSEEETSTEEDSVTENLLEHPEDVRPDDFSVFSDFDKLTFNYPEENDLASSIQDWDIMSLAESDVSEDFDLMEYGIKSSDDGSSGKAVVVVALPMNFRDALLSDKPSLLSTFIVVDSPLKEGAAAGEKTRKVYKCTKKVPRDQPDASEDCCVEDEEREFGQIQRGFAKSKGYRTRARMTTHPNRKPVRS